MSELILQLEWRLDQLKRADLTPQQKQRLEAGIKELRNDIAFVLSCDSPEAA
jgi:hypothetical protein